MNIYMDMEFTGLHQRTTLISLGMIAENGQSLYLEFIDYDKAQVDDWIQENVINHLWVNKVPDAYKAKVKNDRLVYDLNSTKQWAYVMIKEWLNQFGDKVTIWSDTYAYDWVLFCELFGGARHVPENVYYIPFDLSTLFLTNGINPDIKREMFAAAQEGEKKHNALWDAEVIRKCVRKLITDKTMNVI